MPGILLGMQGVEQNRLGLCHHEAGVGGLTQTYKYFTIGCNYHCKGKVQDTTEIILGRKGLIRWHSLRT